jgi:hypothetical protein
MPWTSQAARKSPHGPSTDGPVLLRDGTGEFTRTFDDFFVAEGVPT